MSVMGDKGQHPQAWPYNMYGVYNPNAPPQNWQFSAYTEAMPQNFQYMNYGYHGQMAYPSMQNGQVYKPMMQGPIKQFTPGGQLLSFGQEKKEKQQEEEKDKGQDLPPLPPGPPPSNTVSQPSPPGINPFYQQNSGAGPLRFNMNRPQRPQFNQGGLFNNSGASKKKRKKKNKFNQQQQTQGQMFGPATSHHMIRPPLPPQMKAPPLPPGPPPASPKPPPDDIVIPPEPKATSSLEFDYKGEADWPGDLKKYISECYTKCKTSVDKDRVSIILKGKILRATNDGTLWDKNWATEPFPLLQGELETLSVQPVYKPPADLCQPQFKKRPSATLSSRLGQRQISRSKSASRSRSRSPPKSRQRSPIRNRRRRDRSDSSESENNWTPPPTSKKAKGRNLNLDKRGGKGKKGKGDTERSVSTSECCSIVVSDDIDTQSSNVSIEVVITQPYRYYIQEDKKTPVSDFCTNSRGHFYSEFGEVSGEVPVNSELLEKRAARFNSSRRSKANKNGYMNTTVTFSNTSLLGVMEDTNGDFELADCHVVGVCQDVEKPYLRLTAAPEAASVRPPDVLRQALSRVKDRWVQKQDYHYACEQLKSIRQDLTVQGIRDQLTVSVYETHARIALEKGDHAEFNQCQSQLKLLFDETPTENMREFTAYRILYFIFTKEDMDLHTVMRTLSEEDRKDECVSHALSVRSAWALSNYHKLFKLYRQAPRMSSCLMDWFLPRERKLALKSIIKACYMETMSWFDATGFANLAKTALKEAQKTIDKALDINEEEIENKSQRSLTSPIADVSVVLKEQVPRSESEPELSSSSKLAQSSSIWGSFSGSFFENPKSQQNENNPSGSPSRPTNFISNQPKKSATFRLPESSQPADTSTSPSSEPEPPDDPSDIREEILNYPPVVYRKKEPRNYNNRLSAISSESDRRSSSSCEVLGSCTPDSEPPPSLSSSSSVTRLRQSGSFESVEVLTSPSSVEVLGSSSSEQRYSSDSVSPVLEGEGVPELVEDSEPSVAEDSYTSASETLTAGTVLDLPGSRDLMLSSMDTSFTEPPRDSVGSDCVSSCEEGTLMGSSGEETTLQRTTSTSYLKNLLADAMTEQSPSHREHSPISSESRSDMIKVGSSGHTSGDELETTTSSDIEIISSPTPNGDSSSAASRQSPARLCARGKMAHVVGAEAHSLGKMFMSKPKGHQRELSEASSGGSDDGSEVDKLHKRISEMTEILEVREAKLIDLSRLNSDLQESNNDLKGQLESRLQKQEVSELSEEFTQRLAALERKFQQAIRDKEQLLKQLEEARVTQAAADEEADKSQIIADLRVEGEKLSKQQLALNNIIKKLRATEKDNQKVIAFLKEQLEEYSQEVERSKKALTAKQDVERSQIEAVHQLTKTNQRLEGQVSSLQSQVDSLTSTIVSLQKEVTEATERSSQLQTRLTETRTEAETEVRQRLEAEWGEMATERDQLESTVEQLRERLNQQQEQHDRQVQELRRENAELVRRLEVAGTAAEDVAQSVSAATQPLVRQIDSLTTSHAQAQATWERLEKKMLQQISELQGQMSRLEESERSCREQVVASNSRATALKASLSTSQQDLQAVQVQLQEYIQKMKQLELENNRLVEEHKEKESRLRTELSESHKENRSLTQQLAERAAVDAERLKTAHLQEQLKGPSPPATPRSSPTLSLGRLSIADSFASNVWPSFGDDAFETGSASGRLSSVYESLRPGNTTSLLEGLQSQLKQRDGEVHQLQWELSRREVERAALSNELAALTVRVEAQDKQLADLTSLKTEYDALLLLYGEKLEESQELRMDLQDVKDMYKAQIDQLLKKEPSL